MHKVENFSTIKSTRESKKDEDGKQRFKEILCPLTKNTLIVTNCASCKYCQKIQGVHHSGRSLTSMICLFSVNTEGEV